MEYGLWTGPESTNCRKMLQTPPPAFFSRRNDLHRCSWPTAPALCAREVSCLHLQQLLFKGVTEAHKEGVFFFGKAKALQHSSLLARLGRERDLAGTETRRCKLRHGPHAPPQPALPPASVPGHPSPPRSASTHLWRPGKLHGKRPHRAGSRCVCPSPPAIPQPSLSAPFEAPVASGQAGGISFGKRRHHLPPTLRGARRVAAHLGDVPRLLGCPQSPALPEHAQSQKRLPS